ncbi:hypothetical protein C1645_730856 [Glomus cerebriforme]|uniref:Uncharacterized protein n=1 Tax=Glomus cerebriforme TaxID=658196 RepID=A0A397TMC7_9GLOM|nr:hypothetical protein C1645_730856 [Glomus cerebriforme]
MERCLVWTLQNKINENDIYNKNEINEDLLDTIHNILRPYLKVLIESSKFHRNANINPFIDKVLASKRADEFAYLWKDHEEVFIYEQTGSPNFDDDTEFHIHDYKLLFMKKNIQKTKLCIKQNKQKNKLLVKRKVHILKQNLPILNHLKKQKK